MKKKKQKFNKKQFFIAVGLMLFIPAIIYAINTVGSGFQVGSGNTKQINAHGVCKNVKNNNSKAIFVPTNNSTEWSRFRSYAPNVQLSNCATPCQAGNYSNWSGSCANHCNSLGCNRAQVYGTVFMVSCNLCAAGLPGSIGPYSGNYHLCAEMGGYNPVCATVCKCS